MTRENFITLLQALLHRKPFEPFTVELQEGCTFVVDDPEAVAHCNAAAGFIGPDKEVYFFDSENTVRMQAGAQEAAR